MASSLSALNKKAAAPVTLDSLAPMPPAARTEAVAKAPTGQFNALKEDFAGRMASQNAGDLIGMAGMGLGGLTGAYALYRQLRSTPKKSPPVVPGAPLMKQAAGGAIDTIGRMVVDPLRKMVAGGPYDSVTDYPGFTTRPPWGLPSPPLPR